MAGVRTLSTCFCLSSTYQPVDVASLRPCCSLGSAIGHLISSAENHVGKSGPSSQKILTSSSHTDLHWATAISASQGTEPVALTCLTKCRRALSLHCMCMGTSTKITGCALMARLRMPMLRRVTSTIRPHTCHWCSICRGRMLEEGQSMGLSDAQRSCLRKKLLNSKPLSPRAWPWIR